MKIAMGCDHVAVDFKLQLKDYVESLGHEVVDYGTYSYERCNYNEYGVKVGEAVASGVCDCGIICCGTGVGISIAANKVKGIRCVVCTRVVGIELAKMIVDEWLNAAFEGGRHLTRINQIAEYENTH